MRDIAGLLNSANLASHLSSMQMALLRTVEGKLMGAFREPDLDPRAVAKNRTLHLLNGIGPAAAEAAVHYSITRMKDHASFRDLIPKMNGSMVHNVKLITNDATWEGFQNWSNVLREFLLPRYAYLDFDTVVDPKHPLDLECGYPKFITPIMYRYMYDRDDVARRVVDLFPDESWAADPDVYENEDEGVTTPFEEDWQMLKEDYNVLQMLYRIDRLAGIGHYGALLYGVDDGLDLEAPIPEPDLLAGGRRTVARKPRKLLYLRPFDEYLSFIHQYETDVMHPRYGLAKFYNLVFLDMTIDAAGASIGTRLNRRVHWSRVVHVADNLMSSLVFGVPRQQSCFNRLLDLRKVKGSSAEMFYKGGFPGISFEIDPRFVADDPELDKEEFKREIEDYSSGLQRYLRLLGVKAHTLQGNIPQNPQEYTTLQIKAIAMHYGVPMRIFEGSEEGRLASSQDKLTWNGRLKRRIKNFNEPMLIRNFIDRMVAVGVMRPPAGGKYFVDWEDVNKPTDEDKADLALKWTQAFAQYVSTGLIHLIPPMDFLTQVVGFTPSVALRIIGNARSEGGYDKLLKVDPSQGAGQNGERQNIAGKASSAGGDHEQSQKRDPADKKAEGRTN